MRVQFIHLSLFLLLAQFTRNGTSIFIDHCNDRGCSVCQRSRDTCEKCRDNYYYKNNDCQLCWNVHNYCDSCSQPTINDAITCLQCQPWAFSANNSCHPCSSAINSCATCQPSNYNILNCTKCYVSHYLVNNTCLSCEIQIPHCVECRHDSQHQTFVCIKCDDHIDDWVPQSQNQMYILVDNRCPICRDVIPKCRWCKNNQHNEMTCITCQPPLIVYNKRACIQTIRPCSGSIYNYDDSSCSLCQIEKCSICIQQPSSQAVICERCNVNHYYQQSTNSCIECPIEDCISCERDHHGQFQCTKCGSVHYFKEGYCFRCEIKYCFHCEYTTTGIRCPMCLSGYRLQNNTCVQCYAGITPQSTQQEIQNAITPYSCYPRLSQIDAVLRIIDNQNID